MKAKVLKLSAVPVAVIHTESPRVWELNLDGTQLPKVRDRGQRLPSFVAHDVEIPWVGGIGGIKLPGPPPTPRVYDGHALRDRYMGLKTAEEFLAFLNESGRFTSLAEAERLYGWQLRELIGFQRLFLELATRAPAGWTGYLPTLISPDSDVTTAMLNCLRLGASHPVHFSWRASSYAGWYRAKSLAIIETRDVVSAILATIEIDHLRGAKFAACQRHDCPYFYEITSRHKRKYCTQACAHHDSVCRTRKRQKSKRVKPGSKKR